MKKHLQKLFATALLGVVCAGAYAQTDVTADYIVNPSFEYSAEGVAYTAETALSNGQAFYGWTAPTLQGGYVNIDITNTASHSGYGKNFSASDGTYFFYNRQGWGEVSTSLSQTISSLPVGKYYLSVDYKAAGSNANTELGIKATSGSNELVNFSTVVSVAKPGDTYFPTIGWKQLGAWFTVTNAGEAVIEFTETLKGTDGRGDICLDNVRLYKWDVNDELNYANASATSPMDVTSKFVSNPYFDSNTAGWTSTTGYQNKNRATNQKGSFSSHFFENWNGSAATSGKMSYAANGLPEGTYRLTMAAFGNNATTGTTGLNVYAGSAKTPVTSATPSFYTVTTMVAADGNLEFGLELSAGNTCNWIGLDNVKLEYLGVDLTLPLADLLTEINKAQALAAKAMYSAVLADLNTALDKAQKVYNGETSQSITTISDAKNELVAACSATIPSIAAYEYLDRELATAISVGADVTTYQAGYNNGTYDEEGAIAAAQDVNVATYNQVKNNYLYPYTLDAWTGEIGTASGQHWSGDGRNYYDTNGTNITRSLTNTVTLPAGDYVLKAAGRSAAGGTMVLDINGTKVAFTAKGDTGYGIDTGGNANFSADGTYAHNGIGRGWEWQHLRLTLTEETTLTLKATITTSGWAWGSFSDITLQMDEATCVSLNYSKLGKLLDDCKPWVIASKGEYATTIYPAYQTAYNNKVYTTFEAMEKALADLQAAYDAYLPYAKAYEYLAREIATATSVGVDATEQQAGIENGTYDEAGAIAAGEFLNVAIYEKVKTAYPYDYALGEWTGTIDENSGQHWDGTGVGGTKYFDTWGNNFTKTRTNEVTLPAGDYVLKVAGRTVAEAETWLDVNGQKLTFRARGENGYGVDVSGAANFSPDGTYANGAGRGWEWQHMRLTLTEETVITMTATIKTGANNAWASFSNMTLLMDEATCASLEKSKLQVEIDAAKTVDVTTNVGDAVFQIPTSAATALTEAINKAEGVAATSGLAVNVYETAIADLKAAVATFNATSIKAPAVDEAFRIVVSQESYEKHGYALDCGQTRNNEGGWNIGANHTRNDYMLQAFFFTPTVDKNEFKLHFVDAEGTKHYICTQQVYVASADHSRIRTTEDVDKALAIRIDATSTNGIYRLYNTAHGDIIGVNPGFYTTTTDCANDFTFVPCPKSEIKLNITAAEYATIILPFAAELPAGVEAYSCGDAAAADEVGYRKLTLTPAEKFEANVPYIVKGAESTTTLSGYGTYYPEASLTSGWLTGVYTEGAAPAGSYVLQNGDAGVGFYKVEAGSEPTMKPYRAYLNVAEDSNIRGFIFDEGAATGIDGVAAGDKLVDVYTVSGTLVRSQVAASKALRGLAKGIYVVGGEKKVVK